MVSKSLKEEHSRFYCDIFSRQSHKIENEFSEDEHSASDECLNFFSNIPENDCEIIKKLLPKKPNVSNQQSDETLYTPSNTFNIQNLKSSCSAFHEFKSANN
jgi:hypothetical protein